MNPPQHCYYVPAQAPFLKALAAWILESYGSDSEGLAKVRILLPNRRTCRALRETFLDSTGGKPMLLPQMLALGDVDEEDAAAELLRYALPQSLPPAISVQRRQLLLARLVMNFEKTRFGFAQGGGCPVDKALELARELARFMDDAEREQLPLDALRTLAPDELQEHWQQTLDFLTIVSQYWPQLQQEEGVLNPVAHRNLALAAIADAWKTHPPDYPVIAAGSTGSQSATAALLGVVARLPKGALVLAGLDTQMDDTHWELVTETHPQYALKQLLGGIGIARKHVAALPAQAADERVSCLRDIFLPPVATATWPRTQSPLREGLAHMQLQVADTLQDEARMIAIRLREVLEMPGKTGALITPDRTLARMVAAQMQRFSIAIDDSAGSPLADTPPAVFLRLAVDMAVSQASPVELLSLLRHPLAACGITPEECRRLSRTLELKYLRGVRYGEGLAVLCAGVDAKKYPALHALLVALEKQSRRLAQWFARKIPVAPAELLREHVRFAEWLAGEDRLWAGNAGEQLAGCLAEWMAHIALLPEIDPQSYPGFFDALLAEARSRPRYGLHPRLHIVSPIEARLQHYDLAILGGLNEGSWPALPPADPWMSRPMRAAFGLPPVERAIGQAAHDVYLLCASSPQVVLSRAQKVEGAPTVPSRWLVRLHTLLGGIDPQALAAMHTGERYAQGKAQLDAPLAMAPLAPPAPTPPLEARPRKLRVTAIDHWLRDPYRVYAQYILGLRALDALDEEPGAADFGTLVHKAMEYFLLAWPRALPADPYAALLEKGREAFAELADRPAVAALWWPRFEAMAAWLVAREEQRRGGLSSVLPELEGAWDIGGEFPFTLTTRIDRLELRRDGTAALVDYKTGIVPTASEIERGEANQLYAEALVALHGTLSQPLPQALRIEALEYWKLSGNVKQCKITEVKPGGLEACRQRLVALIEDYNDPLKPYAATPGDSRHNDYAHLTRRQEWDDA